MVKSRTMMMNEIEELRNEVAAKSGQIDAQQKMLGFLKGEVERLEWEKKQLQKATSENEEAFAALQAVCDKHEASEQELKANLQMMLVRDEVISNFIADTLRKALRG